jgi:hypothetical protein
MPGKIMLQIAGPLGDLAFKQAQIAETAKYHTGELGAKANELQTREDIYASEHPILNWLNPVGGGAPTSPVSNPNAPQLPSLGQTFNGSKIKNVRQVR